MKKILLFLALCTLFSLTACSDEPTPIEKCQQKAVSIGEQFLDFEITEAEAVELLESLRVPETEGNGHISLDADISSLAFKIRLDSTYEEIKEEVEWIRNYTYE